MKESQTEQVNLTMQARFASVPGLPHQDRLGMEPLAAAQMHRGAGGAAAVEVTCKGFSAGH